VPTPVAELLAALDDQQRRAATLGAGPAQIIAPAGSGKTSTLVARIGVLVDRGIPPPRILVVTFNRDAATELSERITIRLGLTPGVDGPEVRTLHALARQIVLAGPRPPRLVADRLPLLRLARRRVQATLGEAAELPGAEQLDGIVSAAILEGRDPTGPLAGPLGEVVAAYRDLLAVRGEIDFDGLLATALTLLRDDATRRRQWQGRFSHVLVDEYQDVDGTQVELVALLAEPERNLFVVGDDDQTIYAWRLADVRRILAFPGRYPDAVRIVLETNYRCPPVVVAAADRLIGTNVERVAKRLRAAPPGSPPAPRAGDRTAAAPPIMTWAMRGPDATDRLAAALPGWSRRHGRLAVLARTRSELGPTLLALLRAGVPHATSVSAAVESEAVAALLDDLRAGDLARPPFPALLHARAARGWRRADATDALGEDAHAALDAAAGWAIDHRRTDEYLAAFAAACRRVAELRDPRAPIEVTTVHGSKGREWPLVVVLGLEVERFPNARALADAIDPARALEEERRLAYVAITRCRERLVLAYDPDRASPFVGELMGRPGRQPAYRPTSAATVSR
jgi:superfamily I DNA/RNA helicase